MKKRMIVMAIALSALLGACGMQEEVPPQTTAAPAQTLPTQLPETLPPANETIPQPPAPEELVRVLDYLPGAYQELMYATDRNFTGHVIYDFSDAYLRYGTVQKLAAVSADLEELGLSIKIWDGFRPVSAQWKLWEVCPDSTFVADPRKGHSSHSRGNAVDLTLVDKNGAELEMPTEFDDFSGNASREHFHCSETAAAHAQLLEILMEKHGFVGYSDEWWHYYDTDQYPVEEDFTPA